MSKWIKIFAIIVMVGFCFACENKDLTAAKDALAVKNNEITKMKADTTKEIADAKAIVAARDKTLSEKDVAIVVKDALIAEKDKIIAKKGKELAACIAKASKKVETKSVGKSAPPQETPPVMMAKAVPAAKPSAAIKCEGGICWDPKPEGEYSKIERLGNFFIRENKGNPHYDKDNLVSVKSECHGNSWQDWVVLRNITVSRDKLLTPEFLRVIADHRAKMEPLKSGQVCDKEGRSCLEKTWQVDLKTGKLTVFKNDSNL